MSSPPTAASVSVATKPVLRKGKAVDLGELEGESGDSKKITIRKKWFKKQTAPNFDFFTLNNCLLHVSDLRRSKVSSF